MTMSAPDDRDEGFTRVTLEVSDSDVAWMDALAEYRNELARQQGKKVRKQWSRKMVAESFLAGHCAFTRDQFREMTDVHGPIPVPPRRNGSADEKAEERYAKDLRAYVARVIAWDKRNT